MEVHELLEDNSAPTVLGWRCSCGVELSPDCDFSRVSALDAFNRHVDAVMTEQFGFVLEDDGLQAELTERYAEQPLASSGDET